MKRLGTHELDVRTAIEVRTMEDRGEDYTPTAIGYKEG
jgi:hypothetical protein